MTPERFWTDDRIAIILWCVYSGGPGHEHYIAAFADLADAEEYAKRMRTLNPKRKYDILAE